MNVRTWTTRGCSAFFHIIQALNELGLAYAYHDRSDGGLFTTLCEMAFAGRTGLKVDLTELGRDPVAALFNEELGAVLQVRRARAAKAFSARSRNPGLHRHAHIIGEATTDGPDYLCAQRQDCVFRIRA